MVFLESLTLSPSDLSNLEGFGTGTMDFITSAMIGLMIVFIVIALGFYIYISLAYARIGKKAKITNPDVAWMPMGPIATIFETAKAHWWPFLVGTIGYTIIYLGMTIWTASVFSGSNSAIGILLIIAGFIALLLVVIMAIVWHWKTYESIGKPGWFAIIPVIGVILGFLLLFLSSILGVIVLLLSILSHLILIGIAAWSK